ncbi:hypothetical protein QJS10_CPB11g00156 [Acorus calamus]|uniref:MHD domain-containing protein n=1 Tax=Acorus calamus TaxID=4465 RepID=A0AAV9DSP1_ACOCL|nr:hypothetical protein QJS10_CPB11g00156 [Acorus calamus]
MPVAASAIYFLNLRGDVLINRLYRDDVGRFSSYFRALEFEDVGVDAPSCAPADKPVPNATLQVTGAVGWRREGFVYKKNELGLSDKIGLEKESQVKSRPAKSGKTIELDDVTFHQCVNLTRFNSEKTVSFVPPDGEFELMKYRITEGVNLPFRVLPTIKELGRTRMEVSVKLSIFKNDSLTIVEV